MVDLVAAAEALKKSTWRLRCVIGLEPALPIDPPQPLDKADIMRELDAIDALADVLDRAAPYQVGSPSV